LAKIGPVDLQLAFLKGSLKINNKKEEINASKTYSPRCRHAARAKLIEFGRNNVNILIFKILYVCQQFLLLGGGSCDLCFSIINALLHVLQQLFQFLFPFH